MTKKRMYQILSIILMILLACFFIFPLVWMISSALKTEVAYLSRNGNMAFFFTVIKS